MKYIDQLDLKGKRVFIRADLNVPFDDNKNVADDTRIKASLPAINFALEHGASVVLASHLGRPKGKRDDKYSLEPVARRLRDFIKNEIIMATDCIGDKVTKQAQALKPGQILLLENVRFYNEEEANDKEFAKKMAALADLYVNDAFATAHRAHASTAAITEFMKEKAGGFTLKNELEYFAKAMSNPKRPLVTIFGGSKVSTKMDAIRNVGKTANRIIIGGAMANTFFAADGLNVGKSLYEAEQVENAKQIKKELTAGGCELVLPVDVVVAEKLESGIPTRVVAINDIGANDLALDIGPKSIELFNAKLQDAATIVWNGPVGAFETKEFSAGTYAVVDMLTASKALTVVGGGDTDRALHEKHAMEKIGYVSTAGGAFLELLEGKELPAVKALEAKSGCCCCCE
ncbi:MAG: phosphoglycerate kinase [Deltaproteobacteria bacterium]|nr:phosphoglycerate kinase [Deltaproteobacteria bacterium]